MPFQSSLGTVMKTLPTIARVGALLGVVTLALGVSAGETPLQRRLSQWPFKIAYGLKPCYNEKTADLDCNFEANGYRLPTEAEWEYACHAGGTGDYDFGAPDKLRQFAWFADNADAKTHTVGERKPNRWGIHDLYGNVSEWCEDVYAPAYYKDSPVENPLEPPNPGKDVKRVMRGGWWKASATMCRASFRQGQKTGDTVACFFTDYSGFRWVRRATSEEIAKLARLK